MIGVRVAVPRQVYDHGGRRFRSGIARSAAAVAVGQRLCTALAVGGQQTPELARADAEQRCRLLGIDLVAEEAIKNLAPCAGKLLDQCRVSLPG